MHKNISQYKADDESILRDYCAESQIIKRNGFMSLGIFGAISVMTEPRTKQKKHNLGMKKMTNMTRLS